MWRRDNCTNEKCRNWQLSPAQFYIEGYGHLANGAEGAFYSGHEFDQLLSYCKSHLDVSIYINSLFLSCFDVLNKRKCIIRFFYFRKKKMNK